MKSVDSVFSEKISFNPIPFATECLSQKAHTICSHHNYTSGLSNMLSCTGSHKVDLKRLPLWQPGDVHVELLRVMETSLTPSARDLLWTRVSSKLLPQLPTLYSTLFQDFQHVPVVVLSSSKISRPEFLGLKHASRPQRTRKSMGLEGGCGTAPEVQDAPLTPSKRSLPRTPLGF